MFEFRVTKYNPAMRNAAGAYTRDEWTSICDIGRAFGDVVLTELEYRRAEDAYVTAAVAFLQEAGVRSLNVAGLENHAGITLSLHDGSALSLSEAGQVIRRLLREDFWCRLESKEAFVHVGYDYYMYIGVPKACPEAVNTARQNGLYPEPFQSPYHQS